MHKRVSEGVIVTQEAYRTWRGSFGPSSTGTSLVYVFTKLRVSSDHTVPPPSSEDAIVTTPEDTSGSENSLQQERGTRRRSDKLQVAKMNYR